MAGTMVQIRNVPHELHRRLKARAAMEGLSMSEFVLREVRKALERPTRQEVIDRLAAQPPRRLRRTPATAAAHLDPWRQTPAYDRACVALAEALDAKR